MDSFEEENASREEDKLYSWLQWIRWMWTWYGRKSARSEETQDRAIQDYLQTTSKYCISVQFEARSRERLAILPNAAWLRECHVVVVISNSQYGQQDLRSQDAMSSWEPSSDSKCYGETCNKTVDYRISGVPLSAVEQQDTTRENKVKELIEKFENP